MRRDTAAWWMCAAALTAAGVVHFAFVLLSLLPLNPLSFAWRRTIAQYVHPVSTQNWNLFAPVPIAADYTAHARGFYRQDGVDTPTPWVGFTEPLLAALRRNRLTPFNLVFTVFSKAMSSVYDDTGLARADAAERARLLDEWVDRVKRPRGLVVLEAGGGAALRSTYADRQFDRVQVMLSVRRVPRFSARGDTTGEQTSDVIVFRPSEFPQVATWSGR